MKNRALCGAKTRSGGTCRNTAGRGTDHHGVGRCKFHGGASPIRHGLRSAIARERLGPWIEQVRQIQGGDPLNLTPSIEMMQAAALRFLEKHGPVGPWADFLSRAGKLVDSSYRHKSSGLMRSEILIEVFTDMEDRLQRCAASHISDPAERAAFLAAVTEDWQKIVLRGEMSESDRYLDTLAGGATL